MVTDRIRACEKTRGGLVEVTRRTELNVNTYQVTVEGSPARHTAVTYAMYCRTTSTYTLYYNLLKTEALHPLSRVRSVSEFYMSIRHLPSLPMTAAGETDGL